MGRIIAPFPAGTILGSAIFVAAAFIPRAVRHASLVLLLWLVGGLIVIAGTLTYAELGAMFPASGGAGDRSEPQLTAALGRQRIQNSEVSYF